MTPLALLTWQDTQDCVNLSRNKFTTYKKKLFCVPSSWKSLVEKLSIEVQPSWETLTCFKEPLFPIYIFLLSLVKLKIKFEHLMEEVAWSYWPNFCENWSGWDEITTSGSSQHCRMLCFCCDTKGTLSNQSNPPNSTQPRFDWEVSGGGGGKIRDGNGFSNKQHTVTY